MRDVHVWGVYIEDTAGCSKNLYVLKTQLQKKQFTICIKTKMYRLEFPRITQKSVFLCIKCNGVILDI